MENNLQLLTYTFYILFISIGLKYILFIFIGLKQNLKVEIIVLLLFGLVYQDLNNVKVIFLKNNT